ncbi:MAG TPA: o-succinylbenzoate synthase [Ktedonobacteraceae bacterium]
MKLLNLTWSRYRVPFRAAFHTAHGALTYRSGALVTIYTADGHTGSGEIAPLPTHSGHALDESLSALPALARTLQGRDLPDILRFLAVQNEDEQLPPSLICGLESALLDAWGQISGLRVADLLARGYPFEHNNSQVASRERVPVNAVISGTSTEATIASAQAALTLGFTCLKLKLTEASPAALERVAALRAAIGPAPRLRLDANEGWQSEQARGLLVQCAPYDIEYVEQPLPARDLSGLAALRRISPIPLAADEAVSGLASARRLLRAQAADVLILKPQLAGGLHACRRIIQEAYAQGVTCVITSTLETGIGVSAALHLAAASPEITLPCGLATLPLLEHDLLGTNLPVQQGWLELPAAPGLGVHLDQAMLNRFLPQPDES